MTPAAELATRLARVRVRDAGHGFDAFGMSAAWVRSAVRLGWPLYRRYFRVDSQGSEHLPRAGAAILVANHSGSLPLDAAMLYLDVLAHTDPPRIARPLADVFVPMLPFLSTAFARVGVASGTRGNARALLDGGELLMIFPEGTAGIGKRFRDRYRLQRWNVGHAELAIRHRAPIVPVAIVGAEEQWPMVARLPVPAWTRLPWLPLLATPVPLPVRYHVRYGAPLDLAREWSPEQADDPAVTEAAAARVRSEVERLIALGLRERAGVFR